MNPSTQDKLNHVSRDNNILATDFYKCTHWLQYPATAEHVCSYLEARGGYSDTLEYIGLQMILMDHFEGIRIEQWMIDDAEYFITQVGGFKEYFNREGWQRIIDVHGGKLPLRIKSLPEGMIVPVRTPLFTIENTDPKLPWLTNWAETLLLNTWYPITVATISYNFRKAAKSFEDMCGDKIGPCFLTDFGYRGTETKMSAGRGGCAHLANDPGTDTLEGIVYARRYYGASFDDGPIGLSVFATEHSTTTIHGREHEYEAMEKFIDTAPGEAIVSLVSDSYDIFKATEFLVSIKDKILSRKGKVVVRPDSGDPPSVSKQVMDILWNGFGGTVNEKGYKVLDPHVGVIYADGINVHTYTNILEAVVKYGHYSIKNIIFGMGGGLLQDCNRDTHKFAIKCNAAKVDGKWIDVYKDPITDPGKMSKLGKQAVYIKNGVFHTVREDSIPEGETNLLETVFENGEIVKYNTWNDIKKNISKG